MLQYRYSSYLLLSVSMKRSDRHSSPRPGKDPVGIVKHPQSGIAVSQVVIAMVMSGENQEIRVLRILSLFLHHLKDLAYGSFPYSCIPGLLNPCKYAPCGFSLSGRQFIQLTGSSQVHRGPICSPKILPFSTCDHIPTRYSWLTIMPFKQHDGKIYRIAALLAFHVVFIISACPRQSSAAGDVFLFPPQSGYTGEYISILAFTVGQSIDIKWKSGCDESIQFWLMKDSNGGDCQFQRDARCSQIAETPNNGSTAWNVSFMGLAGPGVYYINGLCSDPGSTRFSCHYFNITSKPVSTSTTAPQATVTIPASTTQSRLQDPTTSISTSLALVGTTKSTTPVGAIVGGVIGGSFDNRIDAYCWNCTTEEKSII